MELDIIAEPLTLKCGLVLKNRLAKAALAECMADKDSLPTAAHSNVYREWSNGGWGMVMTGNVMVDVRYKGNAYDIAVDDTKYPEIFQTWKEMAEAITENNTLAIMQINHPGRQSAAGAGTRGFFEKSISASPVPLYFGPGYIPYFLRTLIFGTPREMTANDIETVIRQFVECARLAHETGFSGVEVDAAHGYLLTQFLSSKTNHRTDAYGGSPAKRAKIVVDVINAIRVAVPKTFCIGIKLNSVDHQSAEELEQCLEQLRLITEAGVDFIEISGGSHEDPLMNTKSATRESSARTLAREAFFLEFASAVRARFPSEVLMVTGGFRSRAGMAAALKGGACDIVGLGRPAVLNPSAAKEIILNKDVSNEEAWLETVEVPAPWIADVIGVKAIGAGKQSAWYTKQIQERAHRNL